MKTYLIGGLTALLLTLFFVLYPHGCETVDGSGHIYASQCLPDGFAPFVEPLSARASYLQTPKSLTPEAGAAVESLIDAAEHDGMCLVVIGAYRTQDSQAKLYADLDGSELVAPPGRSDHQTGLAVDFSGCPMTNGHRDDSADRLELAGPFSELPEYQWLLEHASSYGLEQSYRTDNVSVTGYPAEEWHWEFIKN